MFSKLQTQPVLIFHDSGNSRTQGEREPQQHDAASEDLDLVDETQERDASVLDSLYFCFRAVALADLALILLVV